MEGKQKHSPMLILKGQWSFLYECAPLICDKSIIENSRIATARFRPILYLRGKAIVETLEMYISCRYFSYFVSSSWKKLLESLIFKRQSTRCSLRIIKISEARVTLIDEIFFEVLTPFEHSIHFLLRLANESKWTRITTTNQLWKQKVSQTFQNLSLAPHARCNTRWILMILRLVDWNMPTSL